MNSKIKVESFSNTPANYRRLEDLKDLLASIEDNGETYHGEKQAVQAAIKALTPT